MNSSSEVNPDAQARGWSHRRLDDVKGLLRVLYSWCKFPFQTMSKLLTLLRQVQYTRFWSLWAPGSVWLVLTALPLVILERNILDQLDVLLALIWAAFAAGLLVLVLIGREFLREYYGRILLAIFTLYVLAGLSSYVATSGSATNSSATNSSATNSSATNSSASPGARVQFHHINPQTPGTIFVFSVAVITILGFTITIARLQEAHIRIDSYDRFLSRLALMLNEVIRDAEKPSFNTRWWKRTTSHHDPLPDERSSLKVLCSVPTLGNLTHHDEFIARVYPLWMHIANNEHIRVDMYCLRLYSPEEKAKLPEYLPPLKRKHGYGRQYHQVTEFDWDGKNEESPKDIRNKIREGLLKTTDVGKFYAEMATNRGYDLRHPAVLRSVTQAVEIISELSNEELNNVVRGYEWNEDRLPPFHIFLSDRRVIVAVPLDRTVTATGTTTGEVSMIGYETTDSRVMRRLREVFKERTEDVESESFAVRAVRAVAGSENSVKEVVPGEDSDASDVSEARSSNTTVSGDYREEAKNVQT
jgi:hypothetical protein